MMGNLKTVGLALLMAMVGMLGFGQTAFADTPVDMKVEKSECSATATATWPQDGPHGVGALVVPASDYETSYQEIRGSRVVTLQVHGYVGMTTKIIFEAFDEETGEVKAMTEDPVTITCPDSAVYTTPGYHVVNDREWQTVCEPYSQTTRCRTEIWSSQVTYVNGQFVAETDWHFNNLTYLASPRSLWANNPLGYTGAWTDDDGRRWRTECDTAVSGRNGCRSYIRNGFVALDQYTGDFYWTQDWVFNNIVRFS